MGQKPLRLAIGSQYGRRSGVWRIWANKKGDIYAAVRCLGGIYKVSFHKDGNCHFGLTKSYASAAAARFNREERHLEKWHLPSDPIIRALQILIPESELRETPLKDNKGITWLRFPTKGTIGTISLFLTVPTLKFEIDESVQDASIIGCLRTETRTAWIAYAFTLLDDTLDRMITFEKQRLYTVSKNTVVPKGSRATLWDSKEGHDRHVLELAYDSRYPNRLLKST